MSNFNDSRWNLVALAVVSTTNRPLLSQLFLSETATRQDELSLQFLLHSSLDVCDERVEARARRDQQALAAARSTFNSAQSPTLAGTSSPNPAAGGGGGNVNRFTSMSYIDSNRQSPCFLDKLLQSQRYWSWGYQSATGIRILAITHGDAPRDVLAAILKQTYENVSIAISNPFFDADATLDSDTFLRKISNIAGPHTVMRRILA